MWGVDKVRRLAVLTAVVAIVSAGELIRAPSAAAGNWFEQNFYLWGPRYDGRIPECESGWALLTLKNRFAVKEGRFWNSDLTIRDVGDIRQVASSPWAEGTIPRRFCTGKVLVSDGRWRDLHYSIIEDAGIIGAKWGIEWCVLGLDRNWAYSPNCKMARP